MSQKRKAPAPRKRKLPRSQVAALMGHARAFIELCGRHPFATGLFALLGIFGLAFSFITFGVDQVQNREDNVQAAQIQSSLHRVEDAVRPQAEPDDFDPIASTLGSGVESDNVTFPNAYRGRSLTWILANVPEAVPNVWRIDASLKSVAGREFVQFAPYLVLDVSEAQPFPADWSAIYQGERGDAGDTREFNARITPNVGIQYAALIDKNGDIDRDIDYFSLMPSEPEELMVGIMYTPGYVYTYRVGVPFKYKGRYGVHWLTGKIRAGIPAYELPVAGFENTDFEIKTHPDVFEGEASSVADAARANAGQAAKARLFPPAAFVAIVKQSGAGHRQPVLGPDAPGREF